MNFEDLTFARTLVQKHLVPAPNGACILFNGVTENGYGYVRIRIGGKRKKLYAHRVVAMWQRQDLDIGACSHLCHNKLCCNPDHINVEPAFINNGRKMCALIRRCIGHVGQDGTQVPNCVFF